MSELNDSESYGVSSGPQPVDPGTIESTVGRVRHSTQHFGRAVSDEMMFYILHSHSCIRAHDQVRTDYRTECPYTKSLGNGIDEARWEGCEDQPVALAVEDGRLVPAEDPR
ncbi:hypothetical protein SEA_PUPPER_218 [Gordonia phage Pupper]|uniref:Uncharacterized protein n=1 Tax=Gordonia phage Pupper TaxID=2571249 RepID=A0A4Y6ETQ9_9CAUD|nr:hypothetical protein KHQ83_gp059 [Gordonia phage Pupper]QDF18704.1 hypothetical protein SEA_PUPPER_218 [Gordonia phage Pupper]